MHIGGVIDSSYRGSIVGLVYNYSDDDLILKRGRRLAQFLFLPATRPKLRPIKEVVVAAQDKVKHSSLYKNDEPMDWI